MKKLALIILLSVSLTANSQLIKDSLLIEGHYRTFVYNQPAADLTGGSLMFVIHGSGGSSSNMLPQTKKLEAIAAAEKLLLVYPDGYQRYWNECRKYSTAAANKENINEESFFTAMISFFENKYHINKNKVFSSGMSAGGHMSYKLALTMPGKIKAIASVVANLPDSASSDCVLSGKPLPVLIINGTLDNTNPYNGGQMFVNNASYGVVRSTENTFKFWSSLAGYKGAAKKKLLPDNDPADERTIESYTYSKRKKPTIQLLKVIGGKHDYPKDIDVFTYVWEFFKKAK